MIEGLAAEHLIADKGYDSEAIVEQAERQGMRAVIPPRKNRKEQRDYDKHLYRQRHLVENAFLHSNSGAASLRATQNGYRPSLLPRRFVVSYYGFVSCDDTV